MIIGHQVGDIAAPQNHRDIIIAMNTSLAEPSKLSKSFVSDKYLTDGELELGTVLTYTFSGKGKNERLLHMVICHRIGVGGWQDTEKYLRFGLDYLWFTARNRKYSIVTIGEGRVGLRDGANIAAISRAIADSNLQMVQFQQGDAETVLALAIQKARPVMAWVPQFGQVEPEPLVA